MPLQLMSTLGHLAVVQCIITVLVYADLPCLDMDHIHLVLKPRVLFGPLLDAPSSWSVEKGVFSLLIWGGIYTRSIVVIFECLLQCQPSMKSDTVVF